MSKKEKTGYSVPRLIGKLLNEIKPVAYLFVLCAIICLGSVILSTQTPEIISDLTNILYDFGENGTPIDMANLGKLCLKAAIYYAVAAVFSCAMVVITVTITSKYFTKGLRIKISNKLQYLPVSFVDNTPNGELLSRMMSDVSAMSNTIHIITDSLMDGVVRIVLITIMMYGINPILATAVIVLVPLSVVVSAIISGKCLSSWREYRKTNGQLYAIIEEDFGGFDTVKAFNLENRQHDAFFEITEQHRKKLFKARFLSGLVSPIISFTNNLAYVAVCIIGASLVINKVVLVGDVVAIILFAKMFSGPLESIANGMGSIQHTFACANRVYQLLDKEEMVEVDELPAPSGQGNIEIKNVYFSYTPDKPLIKNLNLSVKAGQKVAIVGPTGGGKTTIVNLLMRFYDVDSGSIEIDGVDIYRIPRAKLREKFSMVLQDTWLFNGTVRENIAYGKENATFEEVQNAAKFAHVDEFIRSLPQGYDTVINEDSTNISSGQKQLLTIARSYLANRPMLILDEATSNIDTRTEIHIQQAMDELLKGRTSFVIAHRLSTIVNADVILVVNNGEIVEQGTHNELMAKNGFYTKIYNSQYELLK